MKRSCGVLCLSAALALGLSACGGGENRHGDGLMTNSDGSDNTDGVYSDGTNGVYDNNRDGVDNGGVYDNNGVYDGGVYGNGSGVYNNGNGVYDNDVSRDGVNSGGMDNSGNVRDPENRAYDGTYGSGQTGGAGDSLMEDAGDALRNGMNDARDALDRAGDAARNGLNDARDAMDRAGDDLRDDNVQSGMAH